MCPSAMQPRRQPRPLTHGAMLSMAIRLPGLSPRHPSKGKCEDSRSAQLRAQVIRQVHDHDADSRPSQEASSQVEVWLSGVHGQVQAGP